MAFFSDPLAVLESRISTVKNFLFISDEYRYVRETTATERASERSGDRLLAVK